MTLTQTGERRCGNCGSMSTYIDKTGRPFWVGRKEGFLCKKCDNKLYTHPKHNPRRLRFTPLGKQIQIGASRTGICQTCKRSVKDGVIKKTELHHTEYDLTNPMAHTVEVCVACHRRLHKPKRRNPA